MKQKLLHLIITLILTSFSINSFAAYAKYSNGTLYFGEASSGSMIIIRDGEKKFSIPSFTGRLGQKPEWYEYRNSITKVVFLSSFASYYPKSTASWFYELSKVTEIEGLEYLNTDSVTNMSYMFYGCSGLTSLNLSNFNTANVTYMNGMFYGCSSLTSLILSSFNTSKVTYMYYMFHGCSGLTSLNLSSFDTAKVTDMSAMFRGCSGLTSLNLSNFDTAKVTDMGAMFYGCSGLTSLNLSSFNTSNVTNMNTMFEGCSGLTSLNLSNFNTSKVTDMSAMFCDCSSLTSLNLSSFNTSNVTYMRWMFDNCSGLTSLNLSSFNTSNVTDMRSMFNGCSGLTSLNLSSFNTAKVTDMWDMFYGCTSLKTIYANSNWNTSTVTSSNNMFRYCTSLVGGKGTKYDASHVDKTYAHPDGGTSDPGYFTEDGSGESDFVHTGGTIPYCVLDGGTLTFYYDSKPESRTGKKYNIATRYSAAKERAWHDDAASVTKGAIDASFASYRPTDTNRWFYGFTKMTEITGMENLITENVTDMSAMFYDCSSLTSLDVSNFKTLNVTDMQFMFSGCGALTNLDVSKFKTSKVKNMNCMFQACSSLASLPVSDFETQNVTDMNRMFFKCSSLKNLDVSSFNTSNVTDMGYMFLNCQSVEKLDVSGFETSKVTDMGCMFYGCSTLTELNLKNFDVKKVTNTEYMFYNCTSLKTIYANTSWNLSVNTNNTWMFYSCTSLVGGQGTKYDSDHVDKTYAHPDSGINYPGYFTTKNGSDYTYTGGTIAYGVLNGGTITFYYDDQWNNRTGTKYVVRESQYSVYGSKMPDWYEDRVKITKGVFDASFANYYPVSTACWFYNCNKLTSVEGMENLNTSNAKSLSGMFRFCYVLKDIDLSNFDTRNVTDMSFLFCFCQSLTNIDVSTFNTEKVTNMEHMFHTCPVEVLDLSMFDTRNVTQTNTMFSDCSRLKTIYGKRGLWTNAKMSASRSGYMFYGCNVLVGGMGTRFDPKHINYEYAIIDDGPTVNPGYLTDPLPAEKEAYAVFKDNVLTFYYDNLLRTRTGVIYRYNAGEFRTGEDNGWAKHFHDALVKTVAFDPSFGDFHELTTTSYWFEHKDMSILTEFRGMQYLNTENVTNMSSMFMGCRALKAVDVSHFDTHNVTTMLGMFCYCTTIEKLVLTNFDTAKCLDMSYMFGECSSMTSVDVSNFDTGRVLSMEKMFYYCSSLPALDITMFDTHSCKNMVGMFKSCLSIPVLDLSSFDTHNVEKMDDATYGGMFEYCNKVRTIYVGDGWSTEKLINHSDLLFKVCPNLVGGAGTVYDPDHTDYTYAHVDGGPSNPGYLTYKSTSCDVNGDGNVDVADIATIIDVMAGSGDAAMKKAADVNGDGNVDVADIATVIDRMAELARLQQALTEEE